MQVSTFMFLPCCLVWMSSLLQNSMRLASQPLPGNMHTQYLLEQSADLHRQAQPGQVCINLYKYHCSYIVRNVGVHTCSHIPTCNSVVQQLRVEACVHKILKAKAMLIVQCLARQVSCQLQASMC